jgi:hypothetical protein
MNPLQTYAVVLAMSALVPAPAGEEPMPTVADPDKLEWKAAPPSLPTGQDRVILQGDPSKPGSEYTFRARMPDGYRVPPHWHSVDENVTVLKGTFMMGMGDKFEESAGMPLKVGTFATMPKKVHHFVWTKGETIIQVHGIGPYSVNYVNPDDDPRRKK